MANDWIIDVLADLKTFAADNGLLALAKQLDDTALIAAAEISSNEELGTDLVGWEVERTGKNYRDVAAG